MRESKKLEENFYTSILSVLNQAKGNRFFSDNGDLLRNAVYEATMQMDNELIKLLLKNKATKEKFFTEVDNILVFDKTAFGWAINNKEFLPDSYTRFKNKIGLVDSNEQFISTKNEVVLSFPYKECILEGGQTKEDQKREEIFHNETLSPDSIDRLLNAKTFTNAVKYTKDKIAPAFSITTNDNLILKGNNLLALTSLQHRYKSQIKLAYWDIPYNTDSDSFGYNDSFNRSTWLTFIKNRTSVVKNLLDDNEGVLLMQCSFHQYSYLKILMDEIFGLPNYKMTMNILVRHPDRILTGDKEFNDVIEYILVYSKNPAFKMPKIEKEKDVNEYVYSVKLLSEGKPYKFGDKEAVMYLPSEYEVIKGEPEETKFKTLSVRGSIKEKNSSGRFYVKYLEKLVTTLPCETLFKVDDIGDDVHDHRYFQLPSEGNKNGKYFQGKPTSSNVTLKPYPNFFNFVEEYNIVNNEGDVEFRNGKKPEELLKMLIGMFTKEGDIVLDAFLGSGTTCSVAHKLKRQYIGIEQMDYIENITLKRLSNTINKTIIENEEPLNNGFVYCELKQLNQIFVDKILAINDDNELLILFEQIMSTGFISYKVKVKDINESESEFSHLSTEDKKKFLIEILDKNMLYVNYCDIDDADFIVSKDEKSFTQSFYEVK